MRSPKETEDAIVAAAVRHVAEAREAGYAAGLAAGVAAERERCATRAEEYMLDCEGHCFDIASVLRRGE